MISREEALAFIIQHEDRARRDFIAYAEKLFKEDGIPLNNRRKFLNAGEEYGSLAINQDWLHEAEQEIWDGVMYMGLDRMRRAVP